MVYISFCWSYSAWQTAAKVSYFLTNIHNFCSILKVLFFSRILLHNGITGQTTKRYYWSKFFSLLSFCFSIHNKYLEILFLNVLLLSLILLYFEDAQFLNFFYQHQFSFQSMRLVFNKHPCSAQTITKMILFLEERVISKQLLQQRRKRRFLAKLEDHVAHFYSGSSI